MAGDRIFMRTDLDDDPRVRRIAFRLKLDVDLVIGKLWRLWAFADSQTEDGTIKYELPEMLDDRLRCPGFSDVLIEVGWLELREDGINIPRFTEYNGKSAKKRLHNAQRMFEQRRTLSASSAQEVHTTRTDGAQIGAQTVHTTCTSGTPAHHTATATASKKTTLALTRVSATQIGVDFDAFWSAYPRKRGKGDAERKWRTLKPDEALRDRIMAALARELPEWRRRIADGEAAFVPHPATWLHQRRWEDEPDPAAEPDLGYDPDVVKQLSEGWEDRK